MTTTPAIRSSIDALPIMFRCPACHKVISATRAILFKTPIQCPQCAAEIGRAQIKGDVDRSMADFAKLRQELATQDQGAEPVSHK
jgi:hypothetical protein